MHSRQFLVAMAALGVIAIVAVLAVWLMRSPPAEPHGGPAPRGARPTATAAATAAPNTQPGPEAPPTTPAGNGDVELQLRFARTGTPANSIRVSYRQGGTTAARVTSTAGRVELPRAATLIEFADDITSLSLGVLDRAPLVSTTIDVPEPVRVAVDLREDGAAAPAGSRVRLGWGPPEPASSRVRRSTGMTTRPGPHEDAPFGLSLPPSPSQWEDAVRDSSSTFTTRWITAEHSPRVVAWTPEGRLAIEDVALPADLAPRTTLASTLALDPPTVLEIVVESSPDFEPIPIALGLREGILDQRYTEKAALLLSIADQIDAPVGDFLAQRGNVFVDVVGTRRVAPVPAFESLYFVARGAIPALVPERTIAVPYAQTTRVVFTADELYPKVTRRRRFAGRCVIEGTDTPAPGVSIVAAWLGNKAEQVTDGEGRFVFQALPENLEIVFQIDAYDTQSPPRFSRSLTQEVDSLLNMADPINVTWEIPAFKWLLVEDSTGLLARAEGSREVIVALERRNDSGQWEFFGDVLDFYFTSAGAEIEVRRPGVWRALVLSDGFVRRYSAEGDLRDSRHEARVGLLEPQGMKALHQLEFRRPNGQPAAGMTVYLTPDFTDAATLETRTDPAGMVRFGPYNIDAVGLRIEGETEGFEGLVPLAGSATRVELKTIAGP